MVRYPLWSYQRKQEEGVLQDELKSGKSLKQVWHDSQEMFGTWKGLHKWFSHVAEKAGRVFTGKEGPTGTESDIVNAKRDRLEKQRTQKISRRFKELSRNTLIEKGRDLRLKKMIPTDKIEKHKLAREKIDEIQNNKTLNFKDKADLMDLMNNKVPDSLKKRLSVNAFVDRLTAFRKNFTTDEMIDLVDSRIKEASTKKTVLEKLIENIKSVDKNSELAESLEKIINPPTAKEEPKTNSLFRFGSAQESQYGTPQKFSGKNK